MPVEINKENQRKHLCVGILAHVDAGKTTLSEALLYESGSIRKLGRVDHGDAFLDTDALERERGITIFSKMAEFSWKDMDVTLLDTPGHADFSTEMERTLGVLDYAVLVISGTDGIQGHTETLWKLLEQYQIPTFLFINKMDRPGTDARSLLLEFRRRLNSGCIDFGRPEGDEPFFEDAALTDEDVMEDYLLTGRVEDGTIARLIRERKIFPCYFGAALKLEGVQELLTGLDTYMEQPVYPADFGARVFKIARDDQGTRLTYMKITGGSLRVKTLLEGRDWQEKADQLRIYSGARYTTAEEVSAGCICAVTGLSSTVPGEGLGIEPEGEKPRLTPVLSYQICLPEGTDVYQAFLKLKQLSEEDPSLSIVWEKESGEIHARVMGEIQIEVLRRLIRDRFAMEVTFADGSIVYRETIRKPVEGVGHFEPLRHYAEVHLLLEPGEPGSGMTFATACSEDTLDLNWQRLILTHLAEVPHRGVLTGAQLTDMRITLLSGKAHLKHTEGGDFRQATYRAVRHGLMRAESVLLEPVYAFRLEVPAELTGRAMSDLQRMNGQMDEPVTEGDYTVLTGSAPVAAMRGYPSQVAAYGKGRARLSLRLKGYEPCHNAEEVIAASGYDPEADVNHPAGSVFCAHGAGYYVPWQEVAEHMHLPWGWMPGQKRPEPGSTGRPAGMRSGSGNAGGMAGGFGAEDKELEEIFRRTYGEDKRERTRASRLVTAAESTNTAGTRDVRANGGDARGRQQDGQGSGEENANMTGMRAGESQRNGQRSDSRNGNATSARISGRPMEASIGRPGAKKAADKSEEYLLVDGYNIIFSWDELKDLAKDNLDGARGRLMEILSNYQGIRGGTLILVFDAYRVAGGQGSISKYHNIYVVFTKEAETADQYIEKTVHAMGRKARVTVATSDGLEQVIILGQGAVRMSARMLKEEILSASTELRELYREVIQEANVRSGSGLFDRLSEEEAKAVQDARLGRRELFSDDKTGRL